MPSYAIRFDIADNCPDDFLHWLSDDGGAYFVVRENEGADNDHAHVLLHSSRSLAALRKSIQRELPDHAGNGGYSLKPCDDDDRYVQYMAKGVGPGQGPTILACHGLDWPICIDELHDAYWKENLELNKERRKKLKGCVSEQLLSRCLEKKITHWEEIAQEYIWLCLEANKAINTFSARGVCNTVWVKVQPDREAAVRHLACAIAPAFL